MSHPLIAEAQASQFCQDEAEMKAETPPTADDDDDAVTTRTNTTDEAIGLELQPLIERAVTLTEHQTVIKTAVRSNSE